MIMATLRQFWVVNWQYLLTTAILLGGAAWTLYTYFDRKKDELAWRRTEFLFDQARYIETDPEINATMRLLEDRDTVTVEDILADTAGENPQRPAMMHSLDKTLNVFDRFAYSVYTAKTLRVDELEIFAWYLEQIADSPELRQYCRDNGYGDVLRLSEDVSPSPTARLESADNSNLLPLKSP
jgi:hypothetical protein